MEKNKLSIFQIVCAVLIGLLIIAVIVQIFVIVDLKNKAENLEKQLENLPEDDSVEECQQLCYDIVVDEARNSATIYKV